MTPNSNPSFWLEFRLISDGLETSAVKAMPLTMWHAANNPVFRLFPALPTELRLKVWEYMIAPRIVGIACLHQEVGVSSVEAQHTKFWDSHHVIKPSIPSLLHINRETRILALKHYELSFEWNVPRVLLGTDLHPPPVQSASPSASPMPPPHPPSTTTTSQTENTPQPDPAIPFPHIKSYHDLLDPKPSSSSPSPPSSSFSSTTTATTPPKQRPTSSPPRTYFNFALDTVYLLGELELGGDYGFNCPMTYFIPPQTTRRVRKVALPFASIGYGDTGGQQMFGSLFHVVDRFVPADGEVLLCVTPRDEWTHAMMGNDRALSDPGDREDNVVQGLWRDWYRGSIVRSQLANMQFVLIEEKDLEEQVYESMVARPARRKKEERNGTTMGH